MQYESNQPGSLDPNLLEAIVLLIRDRFQPVYHPFLRIDPDSIMRKFAVGSSGVPGKTLRSHTLPIP